MPDEPRQPQDLRGLLQFCMQAGDNPDSSNLPEMEAERREWLQNILSSMNVDVAGRMRDLIRSLLNYVAAPEELEGFELSGTEDKEEAAIEALEELVDWTEDINFSIDFMKIGGFDLIPALLNAERALGARVRAQTATLLSVLVQNNPTCQDFLLAHMRPVFLRLLSIVDDQQESELVRAKAVGAVSCSIRDHTQLQDCFKENEGFSVLARALQREESVRRRVAFVIACLLGETERFDEIIQIDILSRLVEILNEAHQAWHEHVLHSLLLLLRRHKPARTICRNDDSLRAALQSRMEELTDCPEFEESVSFSRTLCEVLEFPCSDTDIPVLR